MWIGLLTLAAAATFEVVDTDPTLALNADGTVTLVRTATVDVAELPLDEDADADADADADTDTDTGEPPPDTIIVWGLSAGAPAQAITINGEAVDLAAASVISEPISEDVLLARRSQIEGERAAVRAIISASQARIDDRVTPQRPHLDFLEAQLSGAPSITEVPGELRSQTELEHYKAKLGRLDAELVGLLDGTVVERHAMSIEVAPLAAGEHTVVLSRPVPQAQWTWGYAMDAAPKSGTVVTTVLAGVKLPVGVAFSDIHVTADLTTGVLPSQQRLVSFHPDGGLQAVPLAQLTSVYRNLVSDSGVTRRVDVSNPLDIELPANRLALGPTLASMNPLQPGGSFRLGLGPASGWRVRNKGDEYDIRTGMTAPTPVWLPYDPTGCRVAASGEIIGAEQVDGVQGFALLIAERGVVSFQCR